MSLTAILATVGAVLSTVTKICTTVAAVVTVAQSVVSLCQSLGIIKNDMSSEEIGERILVAEDEGITIEQFDGDYDRYMDAIKGINLEDYDLDKWSEQEKALKAIEFATTVLVNDIGPKAEKIIVEMAKNSEFFSAERTSAYIQAEKDGQIDCKEVIDYMNGKITDVGQMENIKDKMIDIEMEIDANISGSEAGDYIDAFRK